MGVNQIIQIRINKFAQAGSFRGTRLYFKLICSLKSFTCSTGNLNN